MSRWFIVSGLMLMALHASALSTVEMNQQQILFNQQSILQNQMQAELDHADIIRKQKKLDKKLSDASERSEKNQQQIKENQRQILLRQNAMMTGAALPIASGKILWVKDREVMVDVKNGRFRIPGNKPNSFKTWQVGDIVDVYDNAKADRHCNFLLENVTRNSQAAVVRK